MVLTLLLGTVAGCRRDRDLDAAIDGGVGRRLVAAPIARPLPLRDLQNDNSPVDALIRRPAGIAVCGDKIGVLDLISGRLVVFDSSGRRLATPNGESHVVDPVLTSPARVHCAGGEFAVADGDTHVVTLWDSLGKFRDTVGMLQGPQPLPYIGDYAIDSRGDVFDSWLGVRTVVGPVLTDSAWANAHLVQRTESPSHMTASFGTPRTYLNVVSRRGLNRTYLVAGRDSVWVLTQGDAMIHGFDRDGSHELRIILPVYERGSDPIVKMGELLDSTSGIRRNKFVSEPSVSGLALASESTFAMIRYRGWHITYVGHFPSGSIEYRARSTIEVVNRNGQVLRSYAVPDFATELATDPTTGLLALVVENSDRSYRVLVGYLGHS